MPRVPVTVFVGPQKLGDMLKRHRADFDFVASFPSVSDFYDALEEEKVTNEIDVIITIDKLFDESGESDDFENMVAAYSPHCLMIIAQFSPSMENKIKERINVAAEEVNEVGNDEYYFILPKSPNQGIDKAKSSYISKHPTSPISYALQGIDEEEAGAQDDAVQEEHTEIIPGSVVPDQVEEVKNDNPGKVISVTSVKGGTGVTTVATLLTAYIAHGTAKAVKQNKGKRVKVCLVDMNLRNGQLGFVIGALRPSILKLRSDGVNDRVLTETIVHSDGLMADCLLLPQKPAMAETLTIEFINDVLDLLKSRYDYVIIDTGSGYVGTERDLIDKVIYPMSDLIVYVTDCSGTSLLSMARWSESVKAPRSKDGMNIPEEKLGVVVNDYMASVGIDGEQIAKLARRIPIVSVVPSNRPLAVKATNQQALPAMLRDKKFFTAIKQLAEAVVGDDFFMSDKIF